MIAKSPLKSLYLLSIMAFMFVTIFDPADVVLGLKVPLFVLCFITGGLVAFGRFGGIYIATPLLIYSLLFVTIPLFSMFVYYVKNGADPYEGFAMFKAYLFIFFAIILAATDLDVTKYLSIILSLMAICIISLFIFLWIFPESFILMNALGATTEIFYVDMRSYGGTFEFLQAYFVCSPMLVVSVAYYSFRLRESRYKDFWSFILLAISVVALMMAGSRNNVFAAVFLLPTLYIIFSGKRIFSIALVSCLITVLVLVSADELASFFDPTEAGNSIKLSYLSDYAAIFSDLSNLFFGQGLGAYHDFSMLSNPYFVTELTYLEVFRNFGLFFGLIMLLMMGYPIVKTFKHGKSTLLQKHIAVAYSFYLVMCFTNPNLFSSMGILILCLVLSSLYRTREVHHDASYRNQVSLT